MLRGSLAVAFAAVLAILAIHASALQKLVPEPMRIEKVKDDLYVVRGPFNPCSPNGCRPNSLDDGLLHEAGDVAVRVTNEGVILVDDKFAPNVPDVLAKVKGVTAQPIKYMLNTHHHADHIGGDGEIQKLGIEIVAHRNIRENILKNKQPGAPHIVFSDQAEVHLGGVEVHTHHNSFVTVDPITHIAYGQDRFGGTDLTRYDVAHNWKALPKITMSRFVDKVQGADLRDGRAWLSTDDAHDGVYEVDLGTGAVQRLGSIGHADGEGEGIDATQTASGDLHVLSADVKVVPMRVIDLEVSPRPTAP
jgi:hypothetical protein